MVVADSLTEVYDLRLRSKKLDHLRESFIVSVYDGVVKVHYPLDIAEFLSPGRADNYMYDAEKEKFSSSFSSKKSLFSVRVNSSLSVS